MNLPINTNSGELTMSSREISELVESRHDKVKQSIERLAERGVIVRPPMGDEQKPDAMGRMRTEGVYLINKRDSYVVVAQLSPEFTARLVDRWQELEQKAAQPLSKAEMTLMVIGDLQVMMDYLGDDIKVLQHDGLTVDSAPDTQKLEQAILDETGYKLMLESGRL